MRSGDGPSGEWIEQSIILFYAILYFVGYDGCREHLDICNVFDELGGNRRARQLGYLFG